MTRNKKVKEANEYKNSKVYFDTAALEKIVSERRGKGKGKNKTKEGKCHRRRR